MIDAQNWAHAQMPGFLHRQHTWLHGEYSKHLKLGVDKGRMRVTVDCEGTMYFLIDNRKLTKYSITY